MPLFVDRIPASEKTDDLKGNRAKAAQKRKSLGQPARYTPESPQGEGWLDRELVAMKTSQRINRERTEDTSSLEEARKRAIEQNTPRVLKTSR